MKYARRVGELLRRVRGQRGMSLQAVQAASKGRFKTAAVGSYERGDRMIGWDQLYGLAEFYDVPVAELLPDAGGHPPAAEGTAGRPRLVFDLPGLRRAVERGELVDVGRWVEQIRAERGDWGGRVLSVRAGDTRVLALLCGVSAPEVAGVLAANGALAGTADPAVTR